jgi:hypothetical protein
MAYPWTANDVLTAADLNAAIGTGIISTGLGAWTPYTPSWTGTTTNPALGNGTLTGAYWKAGRLVAWRFYLTVGSTTTFGTGNYLMSLPVAAAGTSYQPLCNSNITDVSAGTRFSRQGHLWTTTSAIFASEGGTLVTNLSPMTWANTDVWAGVGWYESAS